MDPLMTLAALGPLRLHALDIRQYPVTHPLSDGEAQTWQLSTCQRHHGKQWYVCVPIDLEEPRAVRWDLDTAFRTLQWMVEHNREVE